jgi:hypothetical protein
MVAVPKMSALIDIAATPLIENFRNNSMSGFPVPNSRGVKFACHAPLGRIACYRLQPKSSVIERGASQRFRGHVAAMFFNDKAPLRPSPKPANGS